MTESPLSRVVFVSGLALALFVAVHALARTVTGRPASRWATRTLLGTCILVTVVPIGGLTVNRWVAGVLPGFSVPLLALLVHGTGRALGGAGILRTAECRTLLGFGAAGGVLLYPAALGLGGWDPYAVGWGASWLFGAAGALAALMLVRGNRLGAVLLVAIGLWHLHGLESANYWDYLVDPVFAVTAVLMSLWSVVRRRSVAEPVACGGRE